MSASYTQRFEGEVARAALARNWRRMKEVEEMLRCEIEELRALRQEVVDAGASAESLDPVIKHICSVCRELSELSDEWPSTATFRGPYED